MLRRAALWPHRPPALTADMLDGIDRPALIKLAQTHRMLPLLSGAIIAAGLGDLWPELQVAQRRTSIRALAQAAMTIRLLEALAAADCRALVLKGQALSLQIYQRTDLRMSSDIDFLIDPAMAQQAHDVMIETGFTPQYPVPVEKLAFVNKDQIYIRDGMRVEIHWRLFDNQAFLPWTFDELWQSRAFVPLMQSRDVPTLARDFHLLYQALHGLRHGWKRCRWLVDLAIPLHSEQDMKTLFALADRYNFVPALIHIVGLVESFLQAPLPPPPVVPRRHAIRADLIDQQIARLNRIVTLPESGNLSQWAKQRFHEKILDLLICPNFKSFLIEMKQYFIGIGDLIDANLPKRFLWLYILARPFLFIRRLFIRKRSQDR